MPGIMPRPLTVKNKRQLRNKLKLWDTKIDMRKVNCITFRQLNGENFNANSDSKMHIDDERKWRKQATENFVLNSHMRILLIALFYNFTTS